MMNFLSPIEAYEEDGIIIFYIVDEGCKVILSSGKLYRQDLVYEIARQRLKRYMENKL